MTLYLILLIVALVLSAFFSASETAYTTAGRLAIEVYHRHGRRGATAAKRLYSRPGLLFSTTLVGTNLVGVIYGSVAALLLNRMGVPLEWIVVITPILLLIFGEVLPKAYAREHPESFALLVSWPIWASYWLLYPLIVFARASSHALLAIFGVHEDDREHGDISLGELRGVWGELHRTGALNDQEVQLLDHVVRLREQKMRDVMRPRIEIVALPDDATIEEAEHIVKARGLSRIPVYSQTMDNITGVLLAKDLLNHPGKLDDVVRPVLYVPEQAPVSKFFGLFRRGESGLTVVIDEYGGTAGVVTLEDVIEEVVGEIEDEHDPEARIGKLVAKGVYLVPAWAELTALRDHWKIRLPAGDYETVGGLIVTRLGHIPEVGEALEVGAWALRVVASDERRVKRVLIRSRNIGRR